MKTQQELNDYAHALLTECGIAPTPELVRVVALANGEGCVDGYKEGYSQALAYAAREVGTQLDVAK